MKKSVLWSLVGFGCVMGCLMALGGCLATKSNSIDININNVANRDSIVELAVIGSGPAGWSAAIYGTRGGFATVVITGFEPGGLLTKTTQIENYPGYASIMGPELMENMKQHAVKVGAQVLNDTVTKIDVTQWPYRIETENGKVIYALAVIFAMGALPRKLGVPGEEQYWGHGVTSCAICDAPFFKDENVVVVGGGDSAIEEALQISPYAKMVTILVRKDHLRAAPSMQARLAGYANITVEYNVEIKEIVGDGNKVTGVKLLNHTNNQINEMQTSGVFLAIGHDPNTSLIKDGIAMDSAGYITIKDRTQETSKPGLFAAGEVEDNYYRQAIVAAGRGASAALDASKFLHEIGWNEALKKQLKNRFNVNAPEKNVEKGSDEGLQTITSAESFNKIIAENELVIVDFFTPSCSLCKQMLPALESVASYFGQKAIFAKLDTLQVPTIAQQFFIQQVPCILAFHKGNLVGRYHDFMTEQQLLAMTQRLINGAA